MKKRKQYGFIAVVVAFACLAAQLTYCLCGVDCSMTSAALNSASSCCTPVGSSGCQDKCGDETDCCGWCLPKDPKLVVETIDFVPNVAASVICTLSASQEVKAYSAVDLLAHASLAPPVTASYLKFESFLL